MLTLDEISVRIKEGKKNNGRSIIFNLLKYFEDKYPQDYIIKMLSEKHQIDISLANLKMLKNRYYKEFSTPNSSKSTLVATSKIDKNQEIKEKKQWPETPYHLLTPEQQKERMEFLLDPANLPPKRVKF